MAHSMNISDMIEELEALRSQYGEDIEVVFSYDYGDHCHSQVAQPVTEIEHGLVVRSEYFRMDKVIDDQDNEDTREKRNVLIIK